MSPDRTAPTTLRHAPAARAAAPEAPADGFAALLGAAGGRAEPARRERPSADEHGRANVDERERPRGDEQAGGPQVDEPGRPRSDERPPAVAPHGDEQVRAVPPHTGDHAPPVAAPGVAPTPGAEPPPAPSLAPAAGVVAPAAGVPVLAPPAAPADAPVVPPGFVAVDAASAAAPVVAAVPPAPAVPVELAVPLQAGAPIVAPQGAPGPAEPTTPPAAASAPVATAVPAPPAPGTDAAPQAGTVPAATRAGAVEAQGTVPESPPQRDGAAREQPAAPPTPGPTNGIAPAQPQPAAAPQLAPSAHRAAPLHHAPRAVAQALELAVERGISHAKLRLRPADLGGVEIRLQTSAAGVTAQVVADSPEAARLLQQAAADLRRALERHDVTLLSLDVSTAGDGRPDGSAGTSADLAGERARHFAAHGLFPREATDAPAELSTAVATVQLPDGVHVDVLA